MDASLIWLSLIAVMVIVGIISAYILSVSAAKERHSRQKKQNTQESMKERR
jgi:type II secretory pathway pseudopilin PulG